jgi:Tfp pilus assembly protein PilF
MAKRDFKGRAQELREGARDPADAISRRRANLALIDVQEGKADDARKRYEKMLEKDPRTNRSCYPWPISRR